MAPGQCGLAVVGRGLHLCWWQRRVDAYIHGTHIGLPGILSGVGRDGVDIESVESLRIGERELLSGSNVVECLDEVVAFRFAIYFNTGYAVERIAADVGRGCVEGQSGFAVALRVDGDSHVGDAVGGRELRTRRDVDAVKIGAVGVEGCHVVEAEVIVAVGGHLHRGVEALEVARCQRGDGHHLGVVVHIEAAAETGAEHLWILLHTATGHVGEVVFAASLKLQLWGEQPVVVTLRRGERAVGALIVGRVFPTDAVLVLVDDGEQVEVGTVVEVLYIRYGEGIAHQHFV